MVLRCILVMLCAASAVLILPVSADPWKDESGHGYYKKKHHKNKHRNRYTGHRLPPWAAVRVSLNNQLDFDREDEPEEAEVPKVEFLLASKQIGIFSGECNREAVAALMGGGGVIGNSASNRDNRTVSTIAGSLISVVLGKEISRNMDIADAQCANHVLERAQDGQAVTWNNPNTGNRYSIIPYQSYQQDDGRYCRKYRAAVNAGSNTKYFGRTACRTDDGIWERFSLS
jgi:surface antigen